MSTLSTKKEKRTKKERKTAATAMEFYRALGMEFILALWVEYIVRENRKRKRDSTRVIMFLYEQNG